MEQQLLLATTIRADTMSSLERQCTRGVLAGLEHGKEFSAHRLAKAGNTDRLSALPHLFNQSVANQQHFDTYAFHDELCLGESSGLGPPI